MQHRRRLKAGPICASSIDTLHSHAPGPRQDTGLPFPYSDTFPVTVAWNLCGAVTQSGEPYRNSRGVWHAYDSDGVCILSAWVNVNDPLADEAWCSTTGGANIGVGDVVKLNRIARFDGEMIAATDDFDKPLRGRPSSALWRVAECRGTDYRVVRTGSVSTVDRRPVSAAANQASAGSGRSAPPPSSEALNASFASYLSRTQNA